MGQFKWINSLMWFWGCFRNQLACLCKSYWNVTNWWHFSLWDDRLEHNRIKERKIQTVCHTFFFFFNIFYSFFCISKHGGGFLGKRVVSLFFWCLSKHRSMLCLCMDLAESLKESNELLSAYLQFLVVLFENFATELKPQHQPE